MEFSSLVRQVRPEDLPKLKTRQKNMAKINEYLNAYGLYLQGLSQRGVQSELGHKHLRTTQNQIKRGEEIAKQLGLDTERLQLKIAAAFEQLADISIQQVKDQIKNGRVTMIQDSEGRQEIRCQKGLDPRMLGEAGRGLIRFAEFAGLMDRTPELNATSTVIQLASPADGASFSDRWSQPSEPSKAVDVTTTPVANPSLEAGS